MICSDPYRNYTTPHPIQLVVTQRPNCLRRRKWKCCQHCNYTKVNQYHILIIWRRASNNLLAKLHNTKHFQNTVKCPAIVKYEIAKWLVFYLLKSLTTTELITSFSSICNLYLKRMHKSILHHPMHPNLLKVFHYKHFCISLYLSPRPSIKCKWWILCLQPSTHGTTTYNYKSPVTVQNAALVCAMAYFITSCAISFEWNQTKQKRLYCLSWTPPTRNAGTQNVTFPTNDKPLASAQYIIALAIHWSS